MKPHPVVVNLLTRVEEIIPKWKIVPTKDVIDSAFKDPIKREQVDFWSFFFHFHVFLGKQGTCLTLFLQVRNNKLIYQDKPRLKTALEMLRVSMKLEHTLQEVSLHLFDGLNVKLVVELVASFVAC